MQVLRKDGGKLWVEGNCERQFTENVRLLVGVVPGFDGRECDFAGVRGAGVGVAAGAGHTFHHTRQGRPAGDVRASRRYRVPFAGRVISVYRVAKAALESAGRVERRTTATAGGRIAQARDRKPCDFHGRRAATGDSGNAYCRRIAAGARARKRAGSAGVRRGFPGGAGEMETFSELLERIAVDFRARIVELVSD